ncbi:MAG: ATP-binding protein [Cyclobacteriaceae bacterium]
MSLKNRIALYYLIATALLVALSFVLIFVVVRNRVFSDLEYTLNYEAMRHQREIYVEGGMIRFINKDEMKEREHREAEVNPIFIQLTDVRGIVHDRSPNLKEAFLRFRPAENRPTGMQYELNGKPILQLQVPVRDRGQLVGYIITAISAESAIGLVNTLRKLLLLTFPLVLVALFVTTRSLAAKSIKPVKAILEATNRITGNNLEARVPVPVERDELHQLSISINQLLARIESAMEREKQFTSNASHELRTPLSVMRGTLEVLLRKSRTEREYVEKIELTMREIDRMHQIVEQLLALARFDQPAHSPVFEKIFLNSFLQKTANRMNQSQEIPQRVIDIVCSEDLTLKTDVSLLEIIIDNLLSNALKYSPPDTPVRIIVESEPVLKLQIKDEGIGIKQEDLPRIFQPFYRSESLHHKTVKGTGLGLSLVQKACDTLGIELEVESEVNKGSVFTLRFNPSFLSQT